MRLLNFEDDNVDMQNRGIDILNEFQIDDDMTERLFLHPLAGYRLDLVNRDGMVNQEAVEWLMSMADGMRLLIIDPLSHLHTADENSASQMIKLVQVLKGIGQETGAGIIIAHHTGKGNLQQYARGSSALVDACRVVMTLHRPVPTRGDSFTLELTWAKLNDAAPITPVRLRRTSSGVLVKADEIPY